MAISCPYYCCGDKVDIKSTKFIESFGIIRKYNVQGWYDSGWGMGLIRKRGCWTGRGWSSSWARRGGWSGRPGWSSTSAGSWGSRFVCITWVCAQGVSKNGTFKMLVDPRCTSSINRSRHPSQTVFQILFMVGLRIFRYTSQRYLRIQNFKIRPLEDF